MTTPTPGPWYATRAANIHDQGLIISEATGENVAVSYKAADAPKLAAADDLLKALSELVGMCNMPEVRQAMMKHNQAYYHATMYNANSAIQKAEGNN